MWLEWTTGTLGFTVSRRSLTAVRRGGTSGFQILGGHFSLVCANVRLVSVFNCLSSWVSSDLSTLIMDETRRVIDHSNSSSLGYLQPTGVP